MIYCIHENICNIEEIWSINKNFTELEEWILSNLTENEAFCSGVMVGIGLEQQRVIAAHEQKKPLIIGDKMFYLQSGLERLQEVLEKICK